MTGAEATILAAIIAGVFVIIVPVVVGLWKGSKRLSDNTAAVSHLANVVEGTTTGLGLQARVRALEDWRTATEAIERARTITREEIKAHDSTS